jgi:NADPH:quinone reductase-like Zn-dependent oxidoreductase
LTLGQLSVNARPVRDADSERLRGGEESAVKAARIHSFGPPDVVVVEDVPLPSPGPNEVLVRVMAAGVAPWDAIIREGKSEVSPQPPLTLGSNFSRFVASKTDES